MVKVGYVPRMKFDSLIGLIYQDSLMMLGRPYALNPHGTIGTSSRTLRYHHQRIATKPEPAIHQQYFASKNDEKLSINYGPEY